MMDGDDLLERWCKEHGIDADAIPGGVWRKLAGLLDENVEVAVKEESKRVLGEATPYLNAKLKKYRVAR